MDWQWLYTICSAEGQEGCIQPLQLAYLGVLVLGAVVLFYAGRRSRDLSTSVLALMPVAIAINIAVGALVGPLRPRLQGRRPAHPLLPFDRDRARHVGADLLHSATALLAYRLLLA